MTLHLVESLIFSIMEFKIEEEDYNQCDYLEEEDDEPSYEPEYCEHCEKLAIEGGYEYEFNVTWSNGGWYCDECGGSC